MKNYLYLHLYDEDTFKVAIRGVDGTPYARLDLGETSVFPSPLALVALRAACDTAITDLRAAIAKRWNEEHPEEPTALGRVGECENCQRDDVDLFARRLGLGAEGEALNIVNVCGACAAVDADALAEMAKSVAA